MKNFIYTVLLALLINACDKPIEHQVLNTTINTGWEFSQKGTNKWYPATVPGVVHTDLLNNYLIQDPFFGTNENSLQWIEKENWIYKTNFELDKNFLEKENLVINFNGLDTYAKVKLNDNLILEADNMFINYEIDITPWAKEKNTIEIEFQSPIDIQQKKSDEFPYELPDVRAYTRKAPYQFGWDWGPRFVTAGIWKDIEVSAWNNFKVHNISYSTVRIEENKAVLGADIFYVTKEDKTAKLIIQNKKTGDVLYKQKIDLTANKNHYVDEFIIDNPVLWWPNGIGDPHLYELEAKIIINNEASSFNEKFGIRTIELVQEKDKKGESFLFKVNGKQVFAKGANYIPQDSFLPRVPDGQYRKTIKAAADANMNMLRVWGGGVYEKDIFYEICNEMGIMVWQDFMFACNMYPGYDEYLISVQTEVRQNIERLKGHSSIVLWCGNNEISEGWHHWGWQKSLNYSVEDSTEVWHNYDTVFHKIIPKAIKDLDPQRYYWPSSPSLGWGNIQSLNQGDLHYWGVWWGEEPFYVYKNKVGRFMSEYGFQGMPSKRTIDKFAHKDEQYVGSPTLNTHQKHDRGDKLIRKYMAWDFKVPENFDDYVYMSQVTQAEGIKLAIEAHRRGMPECMGTLYWQLNDCWPVTSWASVDYHNEWKALQYRVKEAYKSQIITSDTLNGRLQTIITNDLYIDELVDAHIYMMDMKGNIIREQKFKDYKISYGDNLLANLDIKELTDGFNYNDFVIISSLIKDEEIISEHIFSLVPTKELNLESPSIQLEINEKSGSLELQMNVDAFTRYVFLNFPDYQGFFSNNYFDMIPGRTYTISFEGDVLPSNPNESLEIKHIRSTYK